MIMIYLCVNWHKSTGTKVDQSISFNAVSEAADILTVPSVKIRTGFLAGLAVPPIELDRRSSWPLR